MPERESRCFEACFVGEKMSTHGDGRTMMGGTDMSPAAVKDWKAINKSRPEERKKVDQKTRKFLPLTDAVIENHLLGKETVGVYPLLPDETCWFLAADFDKKTWEYDSLAFLETCQELNVPAALERSRSGKGGHIWIFFDRALPAITARKLGCVLLTRTMERRHQIGLDSYDRFFPNQDTMPKGGLGNLIALPLQFAPRKSGNSVFIDSDFHPYPDQWQFLSTIRRMPADAAEEIVAEAQRKGDLIGVRMSIADDEDTQDPWTLPPSRKRRERPIEGPLPKSVQIVRANLVYVEKKDLPPAMLNRLLRLAAFQNPEFYKAQAMRLCDVRQAACDRMRPGIRPAHCRASRMSDGDIGSSRRRTRSGPKFGTNGTRARRLKRSSRVSFGRSRRKPSRRSPPTTKASSALRRRSGKPPLRHG